MAIEPSCVALKLERELCLSERALKSGRKFKRGTQDIPQERSDRSSHGRDDVDRSK